MALTAHRPDLVCYHGVMTRKKNEPDQNSLPEATETVTEDTSLPEETSTDHPQGDDK